MNKILHSKKKSNLQFSLLWISYIMECENEMFWLALVKRFTPLHRRLIFIVITVDKSTSFVDFWIHPSAQQNGKFDTKHFILLSLTVVASSSPREQWVCFPFPTTALLQHVKGKQEDEQTGPDCAAITLLRSLCEEMLVWESMWGKAEDICKVALCK